MLLPRTVGPGLYDRITGLCADAGFTPRTVQRAVERQTVCALVETGPGVSPARRTADEPLLARLLTAVGGELT